MCESTDSSDWTPFYMMNLNRFPWLDEPEPVYAAIESCPECSDIRARVIDPKSWSLVRDGDVSSQTDEQVESDATGQSSDEQEDWVSGDTGRDLERPGDV